MNAESFGFPRVASQTRKVGVGNQPSVHHSAQEKPSLSEMTSSRPSRNRSMENGNVENRRFGQSRH
jgi:hypothetical protein